MFGGVWRVICDGQECGFLAIEKETQEWQWKEFSVSFGFTDSLETMIFFLKKRFSNDFDIQKWKNIFLQVRKSKDKLPLNRQSDDVLIFLDIAKWYVKTSRKLKPKSRNVNGLDLHIKNRKIHTISNKIVITKGYNQARKLAHIFDLDNYSIHMARSYHEKIGVVVHID